MTQIHDQFLSELERVGKQFRQQMQPDFLRVARVGADDDHLAKLGQDLPARAAWTKGIARRDDRDRGEFPVAFADRFGERDAFGADGQPIAGVFYVAASVNLTGLGGERRADPESRIRRVGAALSRLRGDDEFAELFH